MNSLLICNSPTLVGEGIGSSAPSLGANRSGANVALQLAVC
jgi:hypothetical protein